MIKYRNDLRWFVLVGFGNPQFIIPQYCPIIQFLFSMTVKKDIKNLLKLIQNSKLSFQNEDQKQGS